VSRDDGDKIASRRVGGLPRPFDLRTPTLLPHAGERLAGRDREPVYRWAETLAEEGLMGTPVATVVAPTIDDTTRHGTT